MKWRRKYYGGKITDSVTLAKRDWELRTFHGEEYSTHRGSSYNSYLVRDENCTYRHSVSPLMKNL